MMSQPVRKASAPRLAPPRRNSRRVGSGISVAASLMSSLASTPGGFLRMRDMASLPLTTGDHGAQALRHDQCHDDVDHQEADDRGHGEEVHIARGIVTAEDSGQLLQLDRFPDRKPGQYDDDAGQDHPQI